MRGRLLLAAVVVVAVLPMTVRGTPCGADFDFHLQNWLELARSWHDGVAYPSWDASANFGTGEPRFVFYPPVSRVLGATLGIAMPWRWTPLVFVALALGAAGWAFRRMAMRLGAGETAATLGACLYVANPYLMFLIYERGALAELLAAVWMPLLVEQSTELRAQSSGTAERRRVAALGLVVALLWLTDAPAAVMGCYLLAVLAAVRAGMERRWAPAVRAAGGLALGAGLAAFWMVPAVAEQRWVEIWRAVGPLMRVEDSFPFHTLRLTGAPAYPAEPGDLVYYNAVLHAVSWIVGALMVAAAVAAWAAWKKRNAAWLPLTAAAGVACMLQLCWSEPVWRAAPELAYVQFAWRWMLVLGMAVAALAAMAMGRGRWPQRARWMGAVMALVFAGAMAAVAGRIWWQPCEAGDSVPDQVAALATTGTEGTDEYIPTPAEQDAVPVGVPTCRVLRGVDDEDAAMSGDETWTPDAAAEIPADVEVTRWGVQDRRVTVTAQQAGFAVLRLMAYPAWRVTRNGAELRAGTPRRDGLIAIPVAAGVNRITVEWRTTGDVWAGRGISAAALAVTLALGWKKRRKRPGEHDRNADRRQSDFA
ncbi:MAG TPA: hypothetical protein VMD25_08730 [Acidobacteriaceae bacterium]|nr:hypothetical protein [Acidobacteriaceae bacterium]